MVDISYSKSFKLEGAVSKNVYPGSAQNSYGNEDYYNKKTTLQTLNMAQSAYYTIQIPGITDSIFTVKKFGDFLPAKSLNLRTASIATSSLAIGMFQELTFITGRKLERLDISIYDKSDDKFEKLLKAWYNKTVPTSGYVSYLSDIVKKITIKSFSPTGVLVNTTYHTVKQVS